MKKSLDILKIILLLILIPIAVDTWLKVQDTKEVVWLIPNDASCSDIWDAETFEDITGKYELKLK